ncbi:MAG: outer membrane beta-barrel protein [Chitinophagales bacterium]|nr:outer membrane beta-barrel protein [Chitinophagales bacterium]
MKKIFIVVFSLVALSLSAQYSVKNRFQTTLGVGITNYGLPFHLGFEYGLFRDISLGFDFNYRYSKETFDQYRIFGGHAKLNYHFNHLLNIYDERWDLYAGAYYNYWLVTNSIKKIEADSANMGYGLQIGMHYFFSQRFAINTEISGGRLNTDHYLRNESKTLGAFKIGLTYRFGR